MRDFKTIKSYKSYDDYWGLSNFYKSGFYEPGTARAWSVHKPWRIKTNVYNMPKK